MKTIAAILCLVMLALFVQPALFPVRAEQPAKVMSCCEKGGHGTSKGCHKSGAGDDCCGNNRCNPFFSQCPICAVAVVMTGKYQLPERNYNYYIKEKFFSRGQHLESSYQRDILHPPQVVG